MTPNRFIKNIIVLFLFIMSIQKINYLARIIEGDGHVYTPSNLRDFKGKINPLK